VVFRPTPLKNDGIKVTWHDEIPNSNGEIVQMFQATNQKLTVTSSEPCQKIIPQHRGSVARFLLPDKWRRGSCCLVHWQWQGYPLVIGCMACWKIQNLRLLTGA